MMQFVAPFLINFGINKAMGMSTGKALGMAGINSFLPGGGATSEAAGGIGGLLYQGGGNMQQLALEGGKTLVSGMAAKKYGLGRRACGVRRIVRIARSSRIWSWRRRANRNRRS
jgi:hypothetical protein